MAENSLFAILLRSRWWISFAIAIVVTAVSAAFFPRDIAPFAMLSALPFFIVGGIAAWRQFKQPSPEKAQNLLDTCSQMSWKVFAQQLQKAWQAEGYEVENLQTEAADFLLRRQGRTTLVSAKRWKAANQGLEPLRSLQAQQLKLNADNAVYVALKPLHENAVAWAKTENMVVLGGNDLANLLNKAI